MSDAVFGLGLAALGRPGYINLGHGDDYAADKSVEALPARAFEVMDAGYAAGVRYYDAARSYGRAEEFLGQWLGARGIPAVADGATGPEAVTVASKWGYRYVADWRTDVDVHEVKELTLANLRVQLGETRALLGERLELYQIHSATLESGVLRDRAVLDELARLSAAGVKVGFSTSGAAQAQTILTALEVGGFDAVQSTWNLLEQSAGDALRQAHAAGLRVVIKEGVANGLLTARGECRSLLETAAGFGAEPDALALAAVLAQPWVDVVLSGATTAPMLLSNLQARELELAPQTLDTLLTLRTDPEQYWTQRSALPWT
jgi:aryl-alcohol dehydrogenase-like predicted oxidoreductase